MKKIVATMIIHKGMSDTRNFADEVQEAIDNFQSKGFEVDIQYSTNEYTQSAFIMAKASK